MRRSLLFLPGNSPSMLFNGLVLPADSLILDLEDAVAPDQKDAARNLVVKAIQKLPYTKEIIVRINALDSEFWEKDLEALVPQKPDVIMPPKSQSPEQIELIDQRISLLEKQLGFAENTIKLLPLIETALGVENAFLIAQASPRIIGLFLGAEDLSADLQSKRSKASHEIFYARGRLINAARALDIEVYDTPFTDVQDLEGLEKDATFARDLGFSGKASISPHHLSLINQIFSPSQEDIEYATQVLAAIEKGKKEGKGAVSLKGKMIDKPIVMRAKRVLQTSRDIDDL